MALSRIRTLVVDDSVFMRTMLKNALNKDNNIEVIGIAEDGREALEKIDDLKPDVITLDIEMPNMNGLEVLRQVMKTNPLPVVMVSTKTQEGAEMTFEALELGAIDYVAKPLSNKGVSLQSFQEQVVQAVKAACSANIKRLGVTDATRILKPRSASIPTEKIIVAIGISAGGPATLHKLIPMIPLKFPPIVVTQHMPADFIAPFANRLNTVSQIEVCEAKEKDKLEEGRMYLAPGDRHLMISKRGNYFSVALNDGPKVAGFKPSVDVLFTSVANTYGSAAIGLIMTGMGNDGSDGIRKLKHAGAATLAQDQYSSIVYGMPKAAYETGCVDQVISLTEIPNTLVRMLSTMQSVVLQHSR